MSRLVFVVVWVVCSLTFSVVAAPKSEKLKGQSSVWMTRKLSRSTSILEGLALGDFDKIAVSAEELKLFAKMEAFARSKTPGYRTQLRIFEEANDEIIRQARRDNIEGVALAFNQLTNSCVNCHKQLRKSSNE
jgi:hypothetical protein